MFDVIRMSYSIVHLITYIKFEFLTNVNLLGAIKLIINIYEMFFVLSCFYTFLLLLNFIYCLGFILHFVF